MHARYLRQIKTKASFHRRIVKGKIRKEFSEIGNECERVCKNSNWIIIILEVDEVTLHYYYYYYYTFEKYFKQNRIVYQKYAQEIVLCVCNSLSLINRTK